MNTEFYQLGKDQELAMDLLENGTQYLYNSENSELH